MMDRKQIFGTRRSRARAIPANRRPGFPGAAGFSGSPGVGRRVAAFILRSIGVLCLAQAGLADEPLRVWFDKPGTNWERESLPLGNGRLGASVSGGTGTERIVVNEQSLWSGWAAENDRPGAGAALERVRALLRENKRAEAGRVALKDFVSANGYGKPDFGAYQAFCDLVFEFPDVGQTVTGYRRELDLRTATVRVNYEAGGVSYQRELLCSHPDQVLAVRLTSGAKGRIAFRLGLDTPHRDSTVRAAGNELTLAGRVTIPDPGRKGMAFEARVLVLPEGGSLTAEDGHLVLEGADSATVILAGATQYKLEYPDYTGTAPGERNDATLKALSGKSWEQLRSAHLADYQRLFRRVELDLGKGADQLPTDQRLAAYRKNPDDRALEALLFQFGRYLLISSSRPGGLPANLQGLWNNSTSPPWNCDYHLNINLQMNYWPAGPANLAECALPLMDWLDDLRKPGAKTARTHYNAGGWVAHHAANVWGYTSPGPARGVHMIEPESAAFICQNVWDYYAFTRDSDWLRRTGWPLLKGAAEFWVDSLQSLPDGRLAASPCFSPEHGPLTIGGYWQTMIIHDLFSHCIEAGGILGTDREFCERLREMRTKLPSPAIGKFGQLREWMDDDLESEKRTGPEVGRLENPDIRRDRHRHISHLYAVYPGTQIRLDTTPELAAAARKSLEFRTDSGTGWSTAWKMNVWARLRDGDRVWALLRGHIARETQPNLWDTCPPFQIDGNFGYTAGVCEMLVQSQNGEIELLPALPRAWPSGSVKGLRARGGFTVDLQWKDGRVTDYRIASTQPRPVRVRVGGKLETITSARDR